MKNIIIALFVVFVITGCTTQQRIQSSWNYERQFNRWVFTIRDKGDYFGDCGDFAFTLQYNLGEGVVYFVKDFHEIYTQYEEGNHALLCLSDRCYDQERSFSKDRLLTQFGTSMYPMSRFSYRVDNNITGEQYFNTPD
jgi:hypothetical protein